MNLVISIAGFDFGATILLSALVEAATEGNDMFAFKLVQQNGETEVEEGAAPMVASVVLEVNPSSHALDTSGANLGFASDTMSEAEVAKTLQLAHRLRLNEASIQPTAAAFPHVPRHRLHQPRPAQLRVRCCEHAFVRLRCFGAPQVRRR